MAKYEDARENSRWLSPVDLPANSTDSRHPEQKLGDFLQLGAHTIGREKYAAFEYAMAEHERNDRRLALWTDGSFNGPLAVSRPHLKTSTDPEHYKPGWHASAVVYREGSEWVSDANLYRPRETYNYVIEARGVAQAFRLAKRKVRHDLKTFGERQWDTLAVFTDDKHFVEEMTTFRTGKPKHMERKTARSSVEIIASTRVLRSLGVQVQLHWVPGHVGVPGNERADEEAKRIAALGQAWAQEPDPTKAWITLGDDGCRWARYEP